MHLTNNGHSVFFAGMKQRIVIAWASLTLLFVSWFYPPWIHYHSQWHQIKRGWFFLFDNVQEEATPDMWSFRIDWPRLLVLDLIIVTVAGGVLYTANQRKE